jgi:hypothetical protein
MTQDRRLKLTCLEICVPLVAMLSHFLLSFIHTIPLIPWMAYTNPFLLVGRNNNAMPENPIQAPVSLFPHMVSPTIIIMKEDLDQLLTPFETRNINIDFECRRYAYTQGTGHKSMTVSSPFFR